VRHACRTALTIALASATAAAAPQKGTPLFNGRDLSGWEHVGPGRFVIEGGLLKTEGGMGLLWYTPRKLGREVLRVVYKPAAPKSNSGVYIRIPERPTEPWMPVNRGYEVQIDDAGDDRHGTGALYSLTRRLAAAARPGQWNVLEVALDGPRTTVTLNGVKVTEYAEGEPVPPKVKWYEPDRGPRPAEGYVGLQNHGRDDTVFFKEISVRPLAR
jgi:3-keto-disaccharide hydrolase